MVSFLWNYKEEESNHGLFQLELKSTEYCSIVAKPELSENEPQEALGFMLSHSYLIARKGLEVFTSIFPLNHSLSYYPKPTKSGLY